ncbi:MAG: 50S ribosomal protein L22 [Actinobacteria bacterium]|nr:50S ribosomal protein L22 [Actinomycetota bacterium]
MPAPVRTNERPGTRATARHIRMSATKARAVLDLIRGADVRSAEQTLRFCERDAAQVVAKLLRSAIANAEHNDDQIGDDLVVSACYADEGRTIRRFRPRARGRATRIRKRTCHITIIVSRMSEDELERRRAREESRPGSRAARRSGQQATEERRRRTRRRRGGRSGGAGAGEGSSGQASSGQPAEGEAGAARDQAGAQVEPEAQVQPEAQVEPEAQGEPEAQVQPEAQGEPEAQVQPEAPEAQVQPEAGSPDEGQDEPTGDEGQAATSGAEAADEAATPGTSPGAEEER